MYPTATPANPPAPARYPTAYVWPAPGPPLRPAGPPEPPAGSALSCAIATDEQPYAPLVTGQVSVRTG